MAFLDRSLTWSRSSKVPTAWAEWLRVMRSLPERSQRVVAIGLALVALLLGLSFGRTSPADAYTGSVESANARYVVASYRHLLGRDPADNGLDHYLSLIAAGGSSSRETMARAMLFGPEGSRNEVRRAYRTILNRAPDQAGEDYWTNHLQTADVVDLRVLLYSSDEYWRSTGSDNRAWVTTLYQAVLGRDPEPAGLTYWTELADSGTPRALIVSAVYIGEESLARRTDAYYRLDLDRVATGSERMAGAAYIARFGERSLHARLWASDEAFQPFYQQATPGGVS